MKYMVIGALLIQRSSKKKVQNQLKDILNRHNIKGELKWNKVNSNYMDFYKDIINYFFKSTEINFRCIVVDKSKVNYEGYHNNDKELAFFKFYFLLLKEKIKNSCSYYIFLDKKPTRDKNRARALKSFLDSHILFNRTDTKLIHLQAYESKENLLIQLSDFITGLVAYGNNQNKTKSNKTNLVNFFQEKIGSTVSSGTGLSVEKVNIFKWIPSSK
jgi:hypothetical protein